MADKELEREKEQEVQIDEAKSDPPVQVQSKTVMK